MRARNLVLVSALVGVGALAAVAFFVRGDDRTRNDALLFLDRYDRLDVDDSVDVRAPIVDELERMPFPSRDVDAVRDTCVDAQRTLLLAEARGVEARAIFDRATDRGRIAEGDIPTETRASIESALAESNAALERVRPLMADCDEDVRQLRHRFQPRRRSQR